MFGVSCVYLAQEKACGMLMMLMMMMMLEVDERDGLLLDVLRCVVSCIVSCRRRQNE